MLYRKIDFTFCGVTLFITALKCITLNKIKKSLVHYGDNALLFASTKNQVPTTYFEYAMSKVPYRGLRVILNVLLGKFHIGVWALSYALHLRCEKFLSDWQGNIVSHYISRKLTVLRKCFIEKSTLHFVALLLLKGR